MSCKVGYVLQSCNTSGFHRIEQKTLDHLQKQTVTAHSNEPAKMAQALPGNPVLGNPIHFIQGDDVCVSSYWFWVVS